MVGVSDPTACGFKGYDFRFMLEANIRSNEPLDIKYEPLEAAGLPDNSMLCDFEKRNSGEITVNVKDDLTGEAVDKAIVTYTCAEETCTIGVSENGIIKEKFPICYGGVVGFAKQDYVSYSRRLNTELDKEENFDARLKPILRKQFRIRKKRLVKNPEGWIFTDSPVGLARNETAFISLTRINEEGESDFSTAAEYTGGISEIDITSGKYDIDIRLSTTAQFIIPAEERCESTILGMEECYTIDQMVFNDSFVNGGLNLNYTFTNNDLSQDTITFYMVSPFFEGIPMQLRKIEDIEEINKIDDYSDQYQLFLRPTFE
jgi:hypothetical protein